MMHKTKAKTEGAKRRNRRNREAWEAAEAVCPISGVKIAVTDNRPPRPSQRDAEAMRDDLNRRCGLMGWPADDDHRRTVGHHPWVGTLYGRLALVGRLGKSPEGCHDAHEGIAAYDRLCRQYRRLVLGQPVPGDADSPPDPDCDPSALAGRWVLAEGALTACGAEYRAAVIRLVEAGPDIWPRDVTDATWMRAALAGLALARHFGLRL